VGGAVAPPTGRVRRFRLTERDLEIAAFINRMGCATSEQVRRRFNLSEPMCWRRLRALRQHALVRSSRPLIGHSIVYPAGIDAPSVRSLDHALTATSVSLELELDGSAVVTERLMRQDEWRAGERSLWSISMPHSLGSDRQLTHRPDLAIRTPDGLVAIEVELTRKSRRRLGHLMSAWARQARYQEVRYLCRTPALRDLVAAQSMEHGADLVVRPRLLVEGCNDAGLSPWLTRRAAP